MSLKTELTSADLDEIRQTVLGEADPLGVAAELAEAAEAGRLADKDDAGAALTLAAEIAESRSKIDAAVRYADRAVELSATGDDSRAVTARAVHARILFRAGRAEEALAEVEALRPSLTRFNDAAAYVSAALSVGGHNRLAEEWLSEAVQEQLAERGTTPTSSEDAGLLFFLLQQRHRVRHALNLQHDTHDNLAERLESRLAATSAAKPADDLLFWPQAEFGKLLEQWPALAEAYGKDFDEHRAHLERSGKAPLSGTVAGLVRFAGQEGDPAAAATRAGYAATLPELAGWPAERNGTCWCGSGLKYKKCCLPRSRA